MEDKKLHAQQLGEPTTVSRLLYFEDFHYYERMLFKITYKKYDHKYQQSVLILTKEFAVDLRSCFGRTITQTTITDDILAYFPLRGTCMPPTHTPGPL